MSNFKRDYNHQRLNVGDKVEISHLQHPYTTKEMIGTEATVVDLLSPASGKVQIAYQFRGMNWGGRIPAVLLTRIPRKWVSRRSE